MQVNNIHIIVFLIIIIIIIFIYNYDIHVTPKGEKLCEDILVDKKNINNIKKQNEINIMDVKQNNVINNAMKVLENIPSEIDQENIQSIVHKINTLYQASDNINDFNKKLKEIPDEYPYNTKYSQLVINLIIKFDNEYNEKISKNYNVDNKISLKKSKKRNKKVSFDDSQNISHISNDDNSEKISENFNNVEEFNNTNDFNNVEEFNNVGKFNNVGEFNNFAPF